MKKLAAILCLSAMATCAYAQGLVNFFNNPTTQISLGVGGSALPAVAGQYYFGLLTAATGSTANDAFTFAGVTGTNQASAGRFTGGFSVPVTGWAAGSTRAFRIVAWSADQGATFNPAWIAPGAFSGYAGTPGGFFGVSGISASGTAGGGPNSLPPLNVFGGVEGLATGFALVPVPEPTSMALAGLGAAALLIFRRRK